MFLSFFGNLAISLADGNMTGSLDCQVKMGSHLNIDDFQNCHIFHSEEPDVWNATCKAIGYNVNNHRPEFDLPMQIDYSAVSKMFRIIFGETNVWPGKGVDWTLYARVESADHLSVTVLQPFGMEGLTINSGFLLLND